MAGETSPSRAAPTVPATSDEGRMSERRHRLSGCSPNRLHVEQKNHPAELSLCLGGKTVESDVPEKMAAQNVF